MREPGLKPDGEAAAAFRAPAASSISHEALPEGWRAFSQELGFIPPNSGWDRADNTRPSTVTAEGQSEAPHIQL